MENVLNKMDNLGKQMGRFEVGLDIPDHTESINLYDKYTEEQIAKFKEQIRENQNVGLTSIESAEKIGIPYKDFASLFESAFCTRK